MGDLNNRFGEMAEHLVAPGIVKRFNELGYHFDRIANGNLRILDGQGNIKTEVAVLLENGEYIIAVEVKTKPVIKDVEHHIKRLEILKEYCEKRRDDRKIRGAIAGAVYGREEMKETLEAGMYVLEQSGDTMKMAIPENFVPREW
jgi:predicted AAA+ superfamily ATPase